MNDKIANLLKEKIICEWFQEFLDRFLYYLFTQKYSPLIACEIRSGIEFLLHFWGGIHDSSHLNLRNERTHYIDNGLERWLNNCGYSCTKVWLAEKPDNYPQNHKWWAWWEGKDPNSIFK